MSVPAMIDSYLAGVETLRQSVAGMSQEQLRARPIPGKWSTQEVVCHLSDAGQVYADRMKRTIAEDTPLLIGYDQSRFAAGLAYHHRDVEEELSLLSQIRTQMARILRTLPADTWTRQGVHSEIGLVTLQKLLQTEIDHIAHHVSFILEKRRALGLPA